MADEREQWNSLYAGGTFDPSTDPSSLLQAYVDSLPEGRALDIATGNGRNAVYLAEHGFDVDAIDIADQALARARSLAADRGVTVNWIQADIGSYPFPTATYDVVMASQYYKLDRITDFKAALKPGGYLLFEHHLRSSDPVDIGPGTEHYRFGANELLRSCLDLTVLHYEETTYEREGRTGAKATLVARNSTGAAQSYPHRSIREGR
ncbi:MAG: class I SAM-dependent methyltransferase [Halobacteriales archaeon]|nr:class I SAM-dependent methyltransferase [Halobacteriales archaeon]